MFAGTFLLLASDPDDEMFAPENSAENRIPTAASHPAAAIVPLARTEMLVPSLTDAK